MTPVDISQMLPACERIAREAGAISMRGYRAGTKVSKKGAIDLVTEFDLACEAHIIAELGRAFPGLRVVAEESHRASDNVGDDELVFYVDPIDGTMNYAHGHPFFCTSIGLCRGAQPLFGVIHAPALAVTWRGGGEVKPTRNEELCQVAESTQLIDLLCATGFPRNRATSAENNYHEFVHIKNRVRGVRRCGSAALDLALVADGTYDVYWERPLAAWDLSAGAALVLAAGGTVTRFDRSAIDVRGGEVVAASHAAYEPFMRMYEAARATRSA